MDVTRRYWAVIALATMLVAGGVILVRPTLVIGAAMIGAWVVAQQYAFVRALSTTTEGVSIDQTLTHDRVVTDQPAPLSFLVSLDERTSLSLSIEPGIPIGATADRETDLSLEPGDRRAECVVDVRWPIAGTFRFDQPTIHVSDPSGLFEERLSRGSTPTVTVDPSGPRNVHLGKGGDRIRRAFGEHEANPLDAGLEPEEIREYVRGDSARLIDWKATARMGYPHVREFEAETDRKTVLLVDHRGTMADGQEGETKLDYARHVALSLAEQVQRSADPLGLYAVDDDGVSAWLPPRSMGHHYAAVRSLIHELVVTPDGRPVSRDRARWSTARMGELAALDGPSSFTGRLRPYADPQTTMDVRTIEDDPLSATVRSHIRRLRSGTWTVIITDDTHRAEVREATLRARRGDNRVLVVLTPTVLFESGRFSDLPAAYDQYSEFESFRRSLDRLDRVSAVELAPGDRLSSVLSTGRARRAVA